MSMPTPIRPDARDLVPRQRGPRAGGPKHAATRGGTRGPVTGASLRQPPTPRLLARSGERAGADRARLVARLLAVAMTAAGAGLTGYALADRAGPPDVVHDFPAQLLDPAPIGAGSGPAPTDWREVWPGPIALPTP